MQKPIAVKAYHSISALGASSEKIWNNYLNPKSFLSLVNSNNEPSWVGAIPKEDRKDLNEFVQENKFYPSLDPSVHYALYTSRKFKSKLHSQNVGINLGSSRGATSLFEQYFKAFDANSENCAEVLSSPTTTLGNVSSWVAHELNQKGLVVSHSITCSTALHALVNAIAYLQSGMASEFIVGGTEAALTPFSIAQMKALKIYASGENDVFPCKSLDLNKKRNTMVLGEGAASFLLDSKVQETDNLFVAGVGYATEQLTHNISISTDAKCFQSSMKMALESAGLKEVDAVVMHAPGTIKGDMSELTAIHQVMGKSFNRVTSNKWKIGHTLGASGALSLEFALMMLEHQEFVSVPYARFDVPNQLNHIMVNAVGFGGNAVSVIVSNKKPKAM